MTRSGRRAEALSRGQAAALTEPSGTAVVQPGLIEAMGPMAERLALDDHAARQALGERHPHRQLASLSDHPCAPEVQWSGHCRYDARTSASPVAWVTLALDEEQEPGLRLLLLDRSERFSAALHGDA